MGFLSGDNIATITVGKDITTTTAVSAYDSANGNVIDTIPAGTDLGICNNAQDNTRFMFGDWWLSFPAPSAPLGNQGAVEGAFWIKYVPSAINVNGAPPSDNSGLNGLPQGLQDLFGNLTNLVIAMVVIVVIFGGIMIYVTSTKGK